MTINKSLISFAAAAALAVGFVGCGSNSGNNSNNNNNNNNNNAGIQTSVQAVDGYMYNVTAKAHYLAEDNASMKTITLESTPTTKDVVSGVVTLGSSTYKLPADTNSSVKSRIKFFSFTNTPSATKGTVFTPAAYIEADGKDGYDTNDTLMGTTVVLAPGNSAIASPITSMIVSANPAIFGKYAAGGDTLPTTKVDLNATTFAQIEANATKIAKNLGLGDINLLTADPVELAKTNPTYKLVSGLLKGATGDDAKTILAAKPATTLAKTLTTISTLKGAKGANLAATLAKYAKNGAFSTADIAGMNVEKSVANGKIQSLTPPNTKGKFALDAIEINDVLSSEFASAGAKIKNSAMKVDFNMTNTDGNISNTAFKLVLALSGDKASMAASDSNNSGAIVVEVPFEINSTKTTSNALGVPAIAGGTLIKWEAKSSNGDQVIAKSDMNASTLGVTNVVTASGNVVTVDANKLITKIVSAADANLTGATGLSPLNGISNLQIGLVDANGTIVGVSTDGKNANPIAKTSITSMTGGISATEAIKVINLGTTDLRGDSNGTNKAPKFVINGLDGNVSGATVTTNYADATASNFTFEVNTSGETGEVNNSVVVSGLPTWVKVEKSTVKSSSGTGNNQVADFNMTIDSNLSTQVDSNVTATFKATDEFGKYSSNNDANLSFFFNAIAKPSTTSSLVKNWKKVDATHYTADINATEVNNTVIKISVTNMMGEANDTTVTDQNSTPTDQPYAFDLNGTTGKGTLSLRDINASTVGATDLNVTIDDTNAPGNAVHIDFNTSI